MHTDGDAVETDIARDSDLFRVFRKAAGEVVALFMFGIDEESEFHGRISVDVLAVKIDAAPLGVLCGRTARATLRQAQHDE